MADKKDNPPKPPEHRPGDAAGAGAKRPYTTLDLKATEVSSPGAKPDKEQPKSNGQATRDRNDESGCLSRGAGKA